VPGSLVSPNILRVSKEIGQQATPSALPSGRAHHVPVGLRGLRDILRRLPLRLCLTACEMRGVSTSGQNATQSRPGP